MLKDMFRKTAPWAMVVMVLIGWCVAAAGSELRLLDLATGKILSGDRATARLSAAQFVLVGEFHDDAEHHRAELEVIRSLHRTGRSVAVGLEMFRRNSQADLDRWVDGSIDETRFKSIYLDNWNFKWTLYRPIFDYARRNKIPMIGLNVPPSVTAQVAFHGFDSLSARQKGDLRGITCNVTSEYRDFIQQAYGAHAHGEMDFDNFCEAQLVWDTAMAVNSIAYAERHPETVLVILAGSGHARKMGIPTQIAKRSSRPFLVLLPLTPGVFDAENVTVQDADYLIVND